jgi:hypothetical protein
MPFTPVSEEVGSALATFFTGGQTGPTHRELDDTFKAVGLAQVDPAAKRRPGDTSPMTAAMPDDSRSSQRSVRSRRLAGS